MVTATRDARATGTLTYQDYLDAPGDTRYELLNGELIMVASPNRNHQTASMNLGTEMNVFTRQNDLGWVFAAPFDVLLEDDVDGISVVQPDIIFVSKEREHIITPANIQGAPDMVVEILSPSSRRRDWRDKLDLYERHGVREYWLIDPESRMLWIMRLRDGRLGIHRVCCEGDAAESAALEGFSVGVDAIFGI